MTTFENFLASPDNRLREIFLLAENIQYPDPAHQFDHVLRVLINAQNLQKLEGGNIEIIVIAALLHDCFPVTKDDPKSRMSSSLSADKAASILADLKYSHNVIQQVYHCIEAHSFSRGIQPTTLEAKIIQDADRLDALGAIGLARVFSVSGSLKRSIYNYTDPFCKNRELNDKQYAIDHFFTKLLKLKETMQTQTAKGLAKTRTQFLKSYLAQFKSEIS